MNKTETEDVNIVNLFTASIFGRLEGEAGSILWTQADDGKHWRVFLVEIIQNRTGLGGARQNNVWE
jgi:hypothetical protein